MLTFHALTRSRKKRFKRIARSFEDNKTLAEESRAERLAGPTSHRRSVAAGTFRQEKKNENLGEND